MWGLAWLPSKPSPESVYLYGRERLPSPNGSCLWHWVYHSISNKFGTTQQSSKLFVSILYLFNTCWSVHISKIIHIYVYVITVDTTAQRLTWWLGLHQNCKKMLGACFQSIQSPSVKSSHHHWLMYKFQNYEAQAPSFFSVVWPTAKKGKNSHDHR